MDRFRAALISTRAEDRICSTVSLRLRDEPELLRWPIAYERPLQLTGQGLDGKDADQGLYHFCDSFELNYVHMLRRGQ